MNLRFLSISVIVISALFTTSAFASSTNANNNCIQINVENATPGNLNIQGEPCPRIVYPNGYTPTNFLTLPGRTVTQGFLKDSTLTIYDEFGNVIHPPEMISSSLYLVCQKTTSGITCTNND